MSRSNVLLLIIAVQILLAALCVSAAPQYYQSGTLDARQPSGEASAEEIVKIIKGLGPAAANDESFALAA